MKKSTEHGFGLVFVLVAVVVVGFVSFAAVRVLGSNKTDLNNSPSLVTKAKVPAKIQTKADLQAASNALEQTPIDSGVNPDQLANDLSSLQ